MNGTARCQVGRTVRLTDRQTDYCTGWVSDWQYRCVVRSGRAVRLKLTSACCTLPARHVTTRCSSTGHPWYLSLHCLL